MAPNAQHIRLLRVVIREDFSCTLAQRLVCDIGRVLEYLDARQSKLVDPVVAVAIAAQKKPKPKNGVQPHTLQSSSLFDQALRSKKAFNIWKKNALHKTNGVC